MLSRVKYGEKGRISGRFNNRGGIRAGDKTAEVHRLELVKVVQVGGKL